MRSALASETGNGGGLTGQERDTVVFSARGPAAGYAPRSRAALLTPVTCAPTRRAGSNAASPVPQPRSTPPMRAGALVLPSRRRHLEPGPAAASSSRLPPEPDVLAVQHHLSGPRSGWHVLRRPLNHNSRARVRPPHPSSPPSPRPRSEPSGRTRGALIAVRRRSRRTSGR